ncbi:MAG: peptide deformylase [Bacteroidota bacterium]|nr:peptide deformylase [Bacteroidota bacterium]
MILPITAYGHPILRKKTVEFDENYPGLQELINNMFETMYKSQGVGLAAPQVNRSLRLFIIDATPMGNDVEEFKDFKRAFLNPYILEESGETWSFNEGCLSIPGVREDVKRPDWIKIEYYDENWELHEEEFSGIPARIIQHEYDHLDGILFPDRLSSLKKRLLKSKLSAITAGKVDVDYRMIFPKK